MVICQLSGIQGELEVTPLSDFHCLLKADNETGLKSTITVYGNLSQSCNLQIKPLSSSQILISLFAGNVTSTDYMYVKRMGKLGMCSNRYVAFMELLQQPCKANFGNAAIQLHFRGDFVVGIQDAVKQQNHSLGCPEDVGQKDMTGALEGQISICKQVKGFGAIIQCVNTTHGWLVYNVIENRREIDFKPSTRCDLQCLNNCTCILSDRQVYYNCSQEIQDVGNTFTRFLLFTSDISCLDLSQNKINAMTVKTFMNIGKWIAYLDLSLNSLTILPSGSFDYLYNIIYLNCFGNLLVTLHSEIFAKLHNLIFLNLDQNSLVTLDVGVFVNFQRLTTLYLSYNELVTLDPEVFASLYSLKQLSLLNNSLVKLDSRLFANLHNLIYLDLDNNALVELEMHIFVNLCKLHFLYLINNRLVTLNYRTFNRLNKLKCLYIDSNRIRYFEMGTFSNLSLLRNLSVAFNHLSFLPFHLFEDLHSLAYLDLSGNKLQSIPKIGHLTGLIKIYLSSNPLTQITQSMFSGIVIDASVFVDQPEVCVCYLNGSNTCFNTIKPSPYLICDRLLSLTTLTIFIWIIGCSAMFGNLFVVWWKRFSQKAENRVQSLLLSNLAMSDLQMGIYMIIIASADAYYGQYFPMYAENWRSSVLCRIAGTLAITSSEASVLFVTFISIDRFITIQFPYSIRKLRVKSTRWISALVWAFSLTLGLTASFLAGRNSDFYDISHVCIGLPLAQVINHKTHTTEIANIQYWENAKTMEFVESFEKTSGLFFSVAIFIAFNMFCFLLILACYIGLIRAVLRTSSKAFRQREMAEEIRMTLKVSTIVLTDFFCWFPICLMGVFVQAGLIELHNSIFAWVVTFVLPINSAINPFLYTIATVISDRCS